MRTYNLFKIIFLPCIGLLGFYKTAGAQQQIMGPSTHLQDVKSILANPALISFQEARFGTGIKAYHDGLDASGNHLTQGFATISAPFVYGNHLGAGINMQYFNSPIYRRGVFSLAASVRLFRYVSLGGQLSALNISYNSKNFELEDRYDPVFQEGYGKTTLNSSIGLYSQPAHFLGLSLGIRNLNEPNISLIDDNVKEPREFFAGLALVQGVFRSTFEIIKGRYDLDGMFYLEAFSDGGNYVRAGSNYYLDQGSIEGQLHIAGPLNINYQYTLPLSSTMLGPSRGSHMFSLIFDFRQRPRLPKPVTPPGNRITFEKPAVYANLESRVYLSSDTDQLTIYEKQIIREIDPRVSDQALAHISLYDLSHTDSIDVTRDLDDTAGEMRPESAQIQFRDLISPEYNRFIQNIGRDSRVSVMSDSTHILRAMELHNLIVQETQRPVHVETPVFRSARDSILYHTPASRDQLVAVEKFVQLEPENISLSLYTSDQRIPVRSWQLNIRNQQDEVIRTFSGTGDMPHNLSWNWREDTGEIIEPGIYSCQLIWENENNTTGRSNLQTLYVQKIQRKVTIEVTEDPDKMPVQPDQIRILIKH